MVPFRKIQPDFLPRFSRPSGTADAGQTPHQFHIGFWTADAEQPPTISIPDSTPPLDLTGDDLTLRGIGCRPAWSLVHVAAARLTSYYRSIELSSIQDQACGIAKAFLIGRDFLGGNPAALIQGENFMATIYAPCCGNRRSSPGSTVFACWVDDPERYGIIESDAARCPLRIMKKAESTEIELRRHRSVFHGLEDCLSGRNRLHAGLIDAEQLLRLAEPMKGTAYGQYLIRQANLPP
jgi:hypothetical protein